jgi:hypothetical protein
VKSIKCFYKNKFGKDGRSSRCIECQSKYYKDCRLKNKAKDKKRYSEKRKEVMEIVNGRYRCHCCTGLIPKEEMGGGKYCLWCIKNKHEYKEYEHGKRNI